MCEIHAETESPSKSTSTTDSSGCPLLVCYQCGRKACKVCCAGKGAVLLVGNNSREMKIYNGPSSQRIKSRVLGSLRRRARADTAAQMTLNHVVGHGVNVLPCYWKDLEMYKRQLQNLFNGEESLAEFPHASLLNAVETASSSKPMLSLLVPIGIGEVQCYWKAPTVGFSIVLGTLSDISGVILVVSSCGYSTSDCPTELGNLVTVGEYRLPLVKPGTALYFDLASPIQARRVIFKLLGDVVAFADDISEM